MSPQLLLVVGVVAVLLGCDGAEAPSSYRSEGSEARTGETSAPAAAPGSEQSPSRSAVLVDLRERLEEARASDADEPVSTGPASVEGLVGTHRGVIENALGAPNECEMVDGRPTPAPCEEEDDVFYSFYHLPEGWNGGGPELLLRYDGAGRCTHAVWRFTQ